MTGIGLFIDGAYLSISWRQISATQLDFANLLALVAQRRASAIVEAYCFDATANGCTNEYFIAMERSGIRVKLYEYAYEEVRDEFDNMIVGSNGAPIRRRIQKGVDLGLATYLLESHRRRRWSELVLVAGDADFAEPVQRLVEIEGVTLTLVGVPQRISHALRPYASDFIDLRCSRGQLERASGRPQTTRDGSRIMAIR